MLKKNRKLEKGFSLIELSMVLVVIALVTAGIMGGKYLIRSAEVNGMVAEVHYYKSAINTFEYNYNALPGDMRNAYEFWGAECDASVSACNGNGDGKIAYGNEDGMAWQHLQLAGYLGAKYTTVGAVEQQEPAIYAMLKVRDAFSIAAKVVEEVVGVPDAYAGCVIYPNIDPIDLPTSDVMPEGGYWLVETEGDGDTFINSNSTGKVEGNALHFGSVSSGLIRGGLLSPAEAQSVDWKYDDGLAASGQIMGKNSFGTSGCLQNSADSGYKLKNTGFDCYSVFWIR